MLEILSIFISEAPGDSIGGSLNGVMLKNDIFMEPGDPAVGGVTGLNKWQRGALQRQERFKHVMHALERLMRWARAERRKRLDKDMEGSESGKLQPLAERPKKLQPAAVLAPRAQLVLTSRRQF